MPKAPAKTPEELEVLKSEAKRNQEEAKLFSMQRRSEEARARMMELAFSQQDREDAIVRNTDIANRVFDFRGKVEPNSVRFCIGLLSTWRRASNLPITLVLDSPGGTVKDGLKLYDYLRFLAARDKTGKLLGPFDKYDPKKGHTGVYVTTLAMGDTSSIAVAILQGGNRRVAAPSSQLMIHESSAGVGGTLSEIADTVKAMEKEYGSVVDILAERAKASRDKIVQLTTRRNHWMNAKEAEELGLVDVIGYQ